MPFLLAALWDVAAVRRRINCSPSCYPEGWCRPCHCLIFDVDPAAASSKHSCAPRTYRIARRARARSSSNCHQCLASARWNSRRPGFAPQGRKGAEAGPIATRSWPSGKPSTTTDAGPGRIRMRIDFPPIESHRSRSVVFSESGQEACVSGQANLSSFM